MAWNWTQAATATNILKVGLGASAVTPTSGQSLDAAGAGATLVIGTSALTPGSSTGILGAIALQDPSFSFSSRTATLLGVPLTLSATASGTAAKAEFRDAAGTTIVDGLTVGTSGTDIIVSPSTTISTGNTLTVTAGSGTL